MAPHSFGAIAAAAYCPRKHYYRQREATVIPHRVRAIHRLARRYPALIEADPAVLDELPLAVTPSTFLANLRQARDRLEDWETIANPTETDVYVRADRAHGIARKIHEGEPSTVSVVSAGTAPLSGVWPAQAIKAYATGEAVTVERDIEVVGAYIEYPATGIIRYVRFNDGLCHRYEAILEVLSASKKPPRTDDIARCYACRFRRTCHSGRPSSQASTASAAAPRR